MTPEKPQKERIDRPGAVLCCLAAFSLVGGFLGSIENIWAAVAGFFGACILGGLGMILNRLERIAHHLQHLRKSPPKNET